MSRDGEPPGTELLIQTPIIYVLISTKNNFKIYISTEEKTLLVLSDNNNDQKIKTKVYKCPSRSASVQFQETVSVLKFSKNKKKTLFLKKKIRIVRTWKVYVTRDRTNNTILNANPEFKTTLVGHLNNLNRNKNCIS